MAAVYHCNDDVKKFWAWARDAKFFAVNGGFETPVEEHEYAVLLSFYDRGVPSHRAIQLLIDWRGASDRAAARLNTTVSTRGNKRESAS